jgi:hypothetical protein
MASAPSSPNNRSLPIHVDTNTAAINTNNSFEVSPRSPKSPRRAASLTTPAAAAASSSSSSSSSSSGGGGGSGQSTSPHSSRGRLSDLPRRKSASGGPSRPTTHYNLPTNASTPTTITTAPSSSSTAAALQGTVPWSALVASVATTAPNSGVSTPATSAGYSVPSSSSSLDYHQQQRGGSGSGGGGGGAWDNNGNHNNHVNNNNNNNYNNNNNGFLNGHNPNMAYNNNQWTSMPLTASRRHAPSKSYGGAERKLHPADDQAHRRMQSAIASVRHARTGSSNGSQFAAPSSLFPLSVIHHGSTAIQASPAPAPSVGRPPSHHSQAPSVGTVSMMIRSRPQITQLKREFYFWR